MDKKLLNPKKTAILMEATPDDEESNATKPTDAFHVDTDLIPQASLEEQGSSELRELGLSVFNQDVFEQGIMEQVDEALAKEEESRLRKILQRELTTISDDILMAKKDLAQVNKAEASLEAVEEKTRDQVRMMESIRRQKENKLKQLKTLKVRRENVTKKLIGFDKGVSQSSKGETSGDDSTFDQAFQLGGKPKKETERERMIRTGEMTPFGTVVKTTAPKAGPSSTKTVQLSGFEKLLMSKESSGQRAKKDFKKYLKKKSVEASKPKKEENEDDESVGNLTSEKLKEKKRNRFDERDWRVYDKEPNYNQQRSKRQARYRIQHEFSGDGHHSGDEDFYRDEEDIHGYDDEEDEYTPSKQELRDEYSDDEDYEDINKEDEDLEGTVKGKFRPGRLKPRKRPRPLPKYRGNSDEEEPVRTARIKRDLSIRQERDDADPENYQERLLRQQRLDDKEEKNARSPVDDEDDDEADFDGGLRVPSKLWKKLFKYQKTGVRWLWELHCQQAGGIVGDEMGLGKTIQTIAFLAALRTSKVRNVNFPYKGLGPTIIVCPTTVMHQWLKECHKWWPEFRVAILHSSGSFSGSESELVRSVAKSFGILITSYNTLVIHQELVLRFNWHYVILDEGHKIRNPDAKVTLCCKQFRTPHRIILSGSPIQNNLKELWSLFDFVFPGKLGTLPDFMQHFSIPIVQGGYSNATQIQVETAYRCACVLRDTINPYLIRRMKADVKKNLDLPNKNEQVLFCRLTDEQRDVYQEYLSSRECNAILQGKFQVFAGLITLRKICNHPDLSTGGPQIFHGDMGPDDPEYQFGFYKRSGKMIVVEALLRLWHSQDHRVLLFTQSKSMLNILEKFVQDQGYTYLTMDGGTSISARQPLISQYNNDRSIYLFLLTTRVGGLGVNLTGADRVIIYDPDWNPSTDMQARERAWRIGQTRQVTIYRLLTSGTIEEKIYHRQIFKQFLTNRVLKDPKQRRLFKSQDMMELFTLGSKDNEEGTETSALFAGTGSDVKIPKKRKKNRFDEIRERKEMAEKEEVAVKSKRERRGQEMVEEAEEDMGVDNDELERMKDFARKLSQKIELEKKQREAMEQKRMDASDRELEKTSEKASAKSSERGGAKIKGETQVEQKFKDRMGVEQLSEDHTEEGESVIQSECVRGHNEGEEKAKEIPETSGTKGTSYSHTITISDEEEKGSSFQESESSSKSHKWKKNGKIWTIPSLKKKRSSHSEEEHEKKEQVEEKERKDIRKKKAIVSSKSKSGDHSKRRTSDEEDEERERRRHKRKRKRHDACFEGERIPHLVKHCALPKPPPQEDQQQSGKLQAEKGDQHHDDYVLRELFKKTGIQGAMKHDKIMESGRPDYAIVEAEAEKVAREAASALRRSRQQCASAMSGLPTWTGQHGGAPKPRFGQKKNSLLVGKSSKSEASSTSQEASSSKSQKKSSEKEGKEKLFDGSISGNVSLSSNNDSLTSNDLLSRIRARKHITGASAQDIADDDDFLRPDRPQTLDQKDEDLLQDIRNYVAFMAGTDGEASTQELVLNFGKRLPKSDAPKFKAMLNQICNFQSGMWRLKAEFR